MVRQIDLDLVCGLYRKYREPLARLRDAQRAFYRGMRAAMTAQLDDLEAEITYLLVRECRPQTVVELGSCHGWSTTWLLSAIRDNGSGHLHSFDMLDRAVTNVPVDLAAGRWTFCQGNIRRSLRTVPETIDWLFVDAAHHGRFARWYIDHLLPRVPPGAPVSVHDVFHGKHALPLTEGSVVLAWLERHGAEFFTASAAKAPAVYRELHSLKRELGLDEPVHTSRDNPMIFFRRPD